MPSDAILGEGTTLGYSTDGSSYTTLGELTDVNIPEIKVDKVKASHYTTANNQHEYKPGWLDVDDVTADLHFDKTEFAALRTLTKAKTTKYWKITYPDGSTDVWQGFIVSMGGTIPNEDLVMTKLAICVNSDITFTAAS